jgi:rubrerythrin
MKTKIYLLLIIIIAVSLFYSCKMNVKETKGVNFSRTIENLKNAYLDEITASKRCAMISHKCKETGFTEVGLLFKAASISEGIHGANFKVVLTKLGEIPQEVIPEIMLGSIPDELRKSYLGEQEEMITTYPEMLIAAKEEHADEAYKYIEYAYKTEIKHKTLYENPMNAMEKNVRTELPKFYYICSVCGFTYQDIDVVYPCLNCKSSKDKYILVDKL